MNILETKNVVKKYGDFTALNNISIAVKENSILGLLGPNGAGKTTLIRIINHITSPDQGEILFHGEPLQQEHVLQIGYLPEERGLYRKMKVGEQAVYLARLKGVSRQDAIKRLKFWFDKFEISSWWNRKVEELSKGMQQKLQFIVTVIHEPKFYIFDEPFSGFDPINTNLLKNEILELRDKGASIIFSTHNMESVEELCDDIVLINKSKKILDGNIKDIKQQFKENIFSLEYVNNGTQTLHDIMPDDFEILSFSDENDISEAQIKIHSQKSSNQLLEILLPHISIHAFREIYPTMNEIFISQVNKINQTTKQASENHE